VRFIINGDLIRDAALGGLAATVRAWERDLIPQGLTFENGVLQRGERSFAVKVGMDWVETGGDLLLAIEGAFALSRGLVWLPGTGIAADHSLELLPVHQGLFATFLQHFQKKGLGPGKVAVINVDEQSIPISYRECLWYAHQKPFRGKLTQDVIPGLSEGAAPLPASEEEEFLLRFLCVACPVFSIHCGDDRFRSSIVVPRVRDLCKFAIRLHRLASPDALCFGVGGRFAGGAEEAALRLITDLEAGETTEDLGSESAVVFTMGTVAWDLKQRNRSRVSRITGDVAGSRLFRKVESLLGRPRVATNKEGGKFLTARSALPALVAGNLARDLHWLTGFSDLREDNYYQRRGLSMLIEELPSVEQELIDAIHQGLKVAFAKAGKRAEDEHADFGSLCDKERARVRTELLRIRGSDTAARWVVDYCTRHGVQVAPKVATLVFGDDWQRVVNLCLFALCSYTGQGSPIEYCGGPKLSGTVTT
jgi:hypothetical protein